jgi:ferric-dicitrate binding protein FerR (iron transport regulator)
MNATSMINRILGVAVLGALLAFSRGDSQTAPAPSAKVKGQIVAARVLGTVTSILKPGAGGVALRDGDSVDEDSTIVTETGASVILVFSNGATVDLAGDSRLKISEFIQDPFSSDLKASAIKQETGTSVTRLYLTKGELVGRVAHLNVDQGSEFTVKTPVGAAGIRGTFFKQIFRPDTNHKAFVSVETFEGLIVVTGLASGPVEVPAGRKFETTVDYNPRDPDNPEDWLPPAPATVQLMFISPAEGAQFQADLQAIDAALGDLVFRPVGAVPNAPPPPAPPLNPPTPGAGNAGP